jgi:hypothetical protein
MSTYVADDELVAICRSVANDLDTAIEAFKIWNWIAENADAINAAKAGEALGTYQRFSINETVLALSRMFDNRNDVLSIKRATNILSGLPLRDRTAFELYLRSLGSVSQDLTSLSHEELARYGANHINDARISSIKAQLKRVRTRRHEHIAHQAAKKSAVDLFEADIRACIEWSRAFIDMTQRCFGTHGEVARVKSPKQSLINICRKAGIVPNDAEV